MPDEVYAKIIISKVVRMMKNKISKRKAAIGNIFKKIMSSRKGRFIASIVVIGVVGTITLLLTSAAPFTASFEPESGTRTSNVRRVDSTPAASGGSFIKFGAGSTSGGGGNPPVTTGQKCTVLLHGAGYSEQAHQSVVNQHPYDQQMGLQFVIPYSGNWADFIGVFWPYDGPHNFQYDPNNAQDEAAYQQYVNLVRNDITRANCGPVFIKGSSNGGAFLAKMFCRGEDFGGRLWAVFINDPVMDTSVLNCNPSSNVRKAVVGYSDEMANQIPASAGDNYRCRSTPWDWYCNDDTTMTVAEYTRQINLHGKINVPVIRIAANHIYNYYPIAAEQRLEWASSWDWWRYFWTQ